MPLFAVAAITNRRRQAAPTLGPQQPAFWRLLASELVHAVRTVTSRIGKLLGRGGAIKALSRARRRAPPWPRSPR